MIQSNMLQSHFSRPLIVGGWIILLACIMCLVAYSKTAYDTMRFEKDGINAEATIIDFYEGSHAGWVNSLRGRPYWVKFSYYDEYGKNYTNTDAYLLSDFSKIQRNASITICYLKDAPASSRLLTTQQLLVQGYLDIPLLCIALMILLGIGLIILGKRLILKEGEL